MNRLLSPCRAVVSHTGIRGVMNQYQYLTHNYISTKVYDVFAGTEISIGGRSILLDLSQSTVKDYNTVASSSLAPIEGYSIISVIPSSKAMSMKDTKIPFIGRVSSTIEIEKLLGTKAKGILVNIDVMAATASTDATTDADADADDGTVSMNGAKELLLLAKESGLLTIGSIKIDFSDEQTEKIMAIDSIVGDIADTDADYIILCQKVGTAVNNDVVREIFENALNLDVSGDPMITRLGVAGNADVCTIAYNINHSASFCIHSGATTDNIIGIDALKGIIQK